MKLEHINLENLKLCGLNVRKKGGKDSADLLPSIRSLGIIQPLLVRPNCEGFEIVAGQRRFHALKVLAEEGVNDPVPCIVMEDGDDAKAIEASLVENIARLPMDEIDQYKAFAALKAEGLDIGEIANRFGVTERLVNQRLAIAGIIAPVLNAYRRDEINAETLRILTMATPRQQKSWWALVKSEDDYAPTGYRLKDWLFGGKQIPVSNALFAVEQYSGTIIADLFGAERYFADAENFWALQNAAIAQKREAYLTAGWGEVVVLDVGQHFATWEHEKRTKSKGGKVFIAITHDGEVTCHEGWLTEKEARKRDKAKSDDEGKGDTVQTERSELTKAMQNYLGLHKHAAVRTELLAQPSIALRLSVAHMIAGSSLWQVKADEQRAGNPAIAESLASAQATTGFAEERRRIRLLLGIGADEDADDAETIVPRKQDWQSGRSLPAIFELLMHMEDNTVLRILTFIMAETLQAQSTVVEGLGALLSTDMGQWWKPDQTFFDLMRDKQAINAMVREVAGDVTADAHTASTAKVQKAIIADCLNGTREAKVQNWLPGYMAFPARGYTGRIAREDETAADVDSEPQGGEIDEEADQPEPESDDVLESEEVAA